MPKESAGLGEMMIVETLSRMDGKLDKLDDRLDGVDKTLVEQKLILDEHVRRTDLLEKKIDTDVLALKAALPEEIKRHTNAERAKLIKLAGKILGGAAGAGGGGLGAFHGIRWLIHLFGGGHGG